MSNIKQQNSNDRPLRSDETNKESFEISKNDRPPYTEKEVFAPCMKIGIKLII